jgi:hypothetical protein
MDAFSTSYRLSEKEPFLKVGRGNAITPRPHSYWRTNSGPPSFLRGVVPRRRLRHTQKDRNELPFPRRTAYRRNGDLVGSLRSSRVDAGDDDAFPKSGTVCVNARQSQTKVTL